MNFADLELPEEIKTKLQTEFDKAIADAKEAAINDPAIVKQIKTNAFAEADRKWERDLKKTFGVDATDLEKVETREDLLKVISEKSNADKNKTSQEWQDKYLKILEDFTTLKEVEIPKIQNSASEQIKQERIRTKLTSKISSFENLTAPKEDLEILIQSKLLQMGINLDLSDDGVVNPITKDGTKPLINDKVQDFDGLITNLVTPYIKQNGANDTRQRQGGNGITIAADNAKEQAILAKWNMTE